MGVWMYVSLKNGLFNMPKHASQMKTLEWKWVMREPMKAITVR